MSNILRGGQTRRMKAERVGSLSINETTFGDLDARLGAYRSGGPTTVGPSN